MVLLLATHGESSAFDGLILIGSMLLVAYVLYRKSK